MTYSVDGKKNLQNILMIYWSPDKAERKKKKNETWKHELSDNQWARTNKKKQQTKFKL